jgi:hypothetical protein
VTVILFKISLKLVNRRRVLTLLPRFPLPLFDGDEAPEPTKRAPIMRGNLAELWHNQPSRSQTRAPSRTQVLRQTEERSEITLGINEQLYSQDGVARITAFQVRGEMFQLFQS